MKQTNWFDRKFTPVTDNGLLPGIIERLAGTPSRLAHKLKNTSPGFFNPSPSGKWSIKKEVGHLIDLEPLWLNRMHDIISNLEMLTVADLSNTKTHNANHDEKVIEELIDTFENHRRKLVALLKDVTPNDLTKSAKHPRLLTPMKIIDLAYFVAEHDDHHLAKITIQMI